MSAIKTHLYVIILNLYMCIVKKSMMIYIVWVQTCSERFDTFFFGNLSEQVQWKTWKNTRNVKQIHTTGMKNWHTSSRFVKMDRWFRVNPSLCNAFVSVCLNLGYAKRIYVRYVACDVNGILSMLNVRSGNRWWCKGTTISLPKTRIICFVAHL